MKIRKSFLSNFFLLFLEHLDWSKISLMFLSKNLINKVFTNKVHQASSSGIIVLVVLMEAVVVVVVMVKK